MAYVLYLYLYSQSFGWVAANTTDFPPQIYGTIEECLQSKFEWNYYYSQAAGDHIGYNKAICVEEKVF